MWGHKNCVNRGHLESKIAEIETAEIEECFWTKFYPNLNALPENQILSDSTG